RPRTVTVAPAADKAAATARPMPRPPPVTRACRPDNLAIKGPMGVRRPPETGGYFKLKIYRAQAVKAPFLPAGRAVGKNKGLDPDQIPLAQISFKLKIIGNSRKARRLP